MTKPCPVCGAAASGKFCSQCGSALEVERVCGDCGNSIPAGGRFCNMCGTPAPGAAPPAPATKAPTARKPTQAAGAAPVSAAPSSGSSKLPWVIGGIAAALVAAVVVIPRLGSDPVATPPPTAATASGGTGTPPDLSSMTPEDAALRLFTRVLTSAEAGDSTEARTFAPMAISAYGMIPELTLDHRYDMAMIHFVTGDIAAAAAQADTILAAQPTHLFGLAVAAEAAAKRGDTAMAREYYQKYVDNYEAEVTNNMVEYQMHANLPAAIRMAALAYLDASAR